MPSTLSALGTLEYNGYAFPVTTRSRLTGQPKRDSAERTTTAVVWRLELSWIIYEPSSGAATDTTIEDIRRRLTTQGGALKYTGHGFGDVQVNSGGATNDVLWGPKPITVDLQPIGAKAAWSGTFVVEWAQPECTSAAFSGIMEFNYGSAHSTDNQGYSRVTIDGHLIIALSRPSAARTVTDTADTFRERITVPALVGFRPPVREFRLSEDKRRLDFLFTFDELRGHGLPYFTVAAGGRHSLHTKTLAGSEFISSITASYTLHRRGGRERAFDSFWQLVTDRLSRVPLSGKAAARFVDFSADEGLYEDGDTVAFGLDYILTSDIQSILEDSGMWRPVPNTNWQQWRTTIQGIDDNRGLAGIKFDAGSDVIVDLCGGAPRSLVTTGQARQMSAQSYRSQEIRSAGWLDYQNVFKVKAVTGLVAHKPLPKDPSAPKTPGELLKTMQQQALVAKQLDDFLVPKANFPPAQGKLDQRYSPSKASTGKLENGMVVQKRTEPTLRLNMVGYGVAIGFRVPCPGIVSYEGRQVVIEQDQHFDERMLGQLCGVPVYCSQWNIPYLIVA